MKQTESIKALLESMAKAQAEFTTLPKDKSGYGYKYTDLDTVISYVRPILSKNGIGFIQMLSTLEGNKSAITTRLFHTSGEWLEDTTPLPDVAMAKTNAAQNLGAAITYMKRYTLCAMLGISSDEDVDGATAPRPAPSDTRGNNREVPAQKSNKGPAGGPDTEDEHKTISELLKTNYPDGKPMFEEEKSKVGKWRAERTAAQVIEYLNGEIDKRMGVYFEEAKAVHDEAKGNTQKVTEKEEEGAQQAFDVF